MGRPVSSQPGPHRRREAGKRDGAIRPDVDARDVVLLIGYLSGIDQAEAERRGRHLLTIVLDGLRTRD